MKTKMHLLKKVGMLAAFAAVFAMGNANATVDDLVASGQFNLFEDDSAEIVFRPDGQGGFSAITAPGNVQQGDYIFGIFDIPIINGTNIDSQGFEVTGILLFEITNLSGPANDATATFGAAGGAAWAAITDLVNDGTANNNGINLGGLGVNGTNLSALFWEDPNNELNVLTQNISTSYANATDGSLLLALDLGTASATNLETDLSVIAGGVPGVSTWGNFAFSGSVQLENLANFNPVSYSGSGTTLTSGNSSFPIANDAQIAFSDVPEPATIALLGLGLLGMGAIRRRHSA